jgi:hypothetical protein
VDANLKDLPEDREALQAMLRRLILERDEQQQRADQQTERVNELYLQTLRLQQELDRYKKMYYQTPGGAGEGRHHPRQVAGTVPTFVTTTKPYRVRLSIARRWKALSIAVSVIQHHTLYQSVQVVDSAFSKSFFCRMPKLPIANSERSRASTCRALVALVWPVDL